jgi:hypothetical protein
MALSVLSQKENKDTFSRDAGDFSLIGSLGG